MSIIYILIPLAVLLTSLGIYLFFWAVRTEQFEDLEKQGMSILFDDEKKHKTTEDTKAVVAKTSADTLEKNTEKTSDKSTEQHTKQSNEPSADKK